MCYTLLFFSLHFSPIQSHTCSCFMFFHFIFIKKSHATCFLFYFCFSIYRIFLFFVLILISLFLSPPSLSSSNIHFCCFHCIFLFFFLSLSFLLCRKLLWLKYITDVNEKNVLEREKETKRRKRREYFVSRRRIIRKYTAAVICIAFHVNPSK